MEYLPPGEGAPVRDGKPGWQTDGSYLTPEGERLSDEFRRTVYLRTVQDWIIRPQMKSVPGVAGADAIGGYVKEYQVQPDPMRLVGYGLSFKDVTDAIEANNATRGANYVERNGEGYVVRAGGLIENIGEIAEIVVATRAGVPILVRDVADVTIGRELRTGSASENGREVVLGTALMLIGGNSRTVSAAADAKITEINKLLPPGIVARTLLSRTELVDATIKTVAKNLAEGALLVVVVLFLVLGNIRAAIITALVIPVAMMLTATGMLAGRISANLMSLGALDFGLIVDGAVIIAENSLRHLAERQHELGRKLSQEERLVMVRVSAEEMIKPTVYGQAIIILVYVPLLTFTGVEGKTFTPMALTVLIALVAAFVLSLTFVPAMIATFVTGRVNESENALIRGIKVAYRPLLDGAIRAPMAFILAALVLLGLAGALFTTLGQEFAPTLDEKNIVMEARRIPSTSISQSQSMQLGVEEAMSKFPQVAFVFSRCGTPDIAADPMPPNACDAYLIMKPQAAWPDPSLTKEALIGQLEAEAKLIPGTLLGFSQPIQMRFNELIAGVRDDLAVKVFGEEFGPMVEGANKIAGILRGLDGAADVKVEEAVGLPFLDIRIDRREIARRGLSLADVQDVIGTAIGGKDAGLVFEGDRRFKIVVRLSDAIRGDVEALKNLPVPLPAMTGMMEGASVPLRQVATFSFTEGPNQVSREDGRRRVVVTANVRGRDIGSLVAEAQARIAKEVAVAGWLRGALGRPVREPHRRAPAPDNRGTGLLRPDLHPIARCSRIGPGRGHCVQRGAVGTHRWRRGPVAPGNAVFGVGGGGVHRPVRGRGAQRTRAPQPHQATGGRGGRCPNRRARGGDDPTSAGRDDGTRCGARLRADGAGDGHGGGSAEAARDRGYRRVGQRDPTDTRDPAGALREVRKGAGLASGRRGIGWGAGPYPLDRSGPNDGPRVRHPEAFRPTLTARRHMVARMALDLPTMGSPISVRRHPIGEPSCSRSRSPG